jgi:hypothetical protein
VYHFSDSLSLWIFNLRKFNTHVYSHFFFSQPWFRRVSGMPFNTADRMQAVQQVMEGLEALPSAEFSHQHSEPPAQPHFGEFYPAGSMASERTYSTQPDGQQNIPQRASIGRSASIAQTVHMTPRRDTLQLLGLHRELIRNLYITKNCTLQEVILILRHDWGLEVR